MKRIIAGLIALLPMLAHSAALDLFMNQRDANNVNTLTRQIAHPPGISDGVFGYIGSTQLPGFLTIGSGLTLSNGTLSATGGSGAPAWADITGKPSFAAVATTGAYSDLNGQPALFSGAYSALTGIPTTFTPSAHTQAWSTITATPTTIAGYGITDGVTSAALNSGLSGKLNTPAGTTAQYLRGDGSLATFPTIPAAQVQSDWNASSGVAAILNKPTIPAAQVQSDWNATTGLGVILNKPTIPTQKRIETYTGTTNASGQITVTYATAFPSAPNVQPPPPTAANQVWTVVSNTVSGFTLQLNQRNTVTLLSVEVLLGATVPVSGAAAQVLVVGQ